MDGKGFIDGADDELARLRAAMPDAAASFGALAKAATNGGAKALDAFDALSA